MRQDVEGMVCAYWSASGRLTQDQLTGRSNFFEVTQPCPLAKADDGTVINKNQKPLQLLRDIVTSLSPMAGWILDACSGTGG